MISIVLKTKLDILSKFKTDADFSTTKKFQNFVCADMKVIEGFFPLLVVKIEFKTDFDRF